MELACYVCQKRIVLTKKRRVRRHKEFDGKTCVASGSRWAYYIKAWK